MSMLPPGQLEQIERLEQLRALENGLEIRVGDAVKIPGPAVDTEEDLARVAVLMNRVEVQRP
jgi:3-deoxy-manno-octulosonate cytidylyltransferase (CMP-KDO synthetase)